MIININQTKTNFSMEWVAYNGNETVAVSKSPFEKGRFQITTEYSNGNSTQRLYFNPSDTTWGSKMIDRFTFKLFENNEKIGSIVGKTKKTGFLKAYAYYEFMYHDKVFYGYEVGLGSKGLYLCLYDGDKLVAIVDKELTVVNYRDVYTAYLEDEQYLNIVIPFTLYYDTATYGDLMDISLLSVEKKIVNTPQKEVKAKYDPEFIPRIKAMHGIN